MYTFSDSLERGRVETDAITVPISTAEQTASLLCTSSYFHLSKPDQLTGCTKWPLVLMFEGCVFPMKYTRWESEW